MTTSFKQRSVRLPSHVKPERYRLMLKPDLKKFVFEGEETVYLTLGKPINEIILHSKDLKIKSAVFRSKKLVVRSRRIQYDKKAETVTLTFARNLPKGLGELDITFEGVLNDQMRGFYRSRYSHNGKEKHLATTQFEATDARRAFPCIDEPAAKAMFDITLMIPKGAQAISNTIESEIAEHESGYRVVKFAPTPKMSTYLVAFIVGEFEWIEGETRDGVLVRIFVTPGKKHQAEFALEVAIKCLEFYNQYFDISYPLPVMDLIAIPDFTHGAMENWGAVTYRETALLVDPQHSSAANKQWVALVIAHELAHQWFGNLVTMEWWTHLWLNEGFASYIEYLAVDHIFPQWDIWTQFGYNDLGAALSLDALENTHPIEIELHHPDEIGEIFDEVSYSKGSCVIRMLADYLGEKDFRNGLRYYLKKHAYANASTNHLWKAFEKISGKPVKQIMQNWTGKPGYPLVKVSDANKHLELTQGRFFSSELSQKESKDKTVWQIPVSLISDKNSKPRLEIMTNKEKDLEKPKGAKWIKINAGESGFFRTGYPPEMLKDLERPVKDKQLSALDRLGLLRDVFATVEAGHLPTPEALSLLEYYKNEDDYTVWVELASGLDEIDDLISEEKYYAQFRDFSSKIFAPMAEKLGWEKKPGEAHTQGLLRSLVLYHAGYYGNQAVIKKAQELFKQKTVPADLRGVVYTLAAENSKGGEYRQLVARYKQEQLQEEKSRLGRALGHFQNTELLRQTLEFAVSKHVRLQDTPSLIMSVWANNHGKELAWEFTKKRWTWFLKVFPSSGHMLARLIKPAGSFASREKAEEFRRFFKTHKAPGLARTVQQVLETMRSNAMWLSRDRERIGEWLSKMTIIDHN